MTFTPFIAGSGLVGYQTLVTTQPRQLDTLRNDPATKREIDYFQQNIGSVREPADLIADRRLLQVALTAFGLESEIDKGAFIEQVLNEGTRDEESLANRLNDTRWRDFAEAFAFDDPNAGYETGQFQAAVELKFRAPSPPTPPVTADELAGFRTGVDKIKNVDDLLRDQTTLKVALAAFGLDGSDYTDQHFRDLIEQGANQSSDYARRIEDGRWRSFTEAFAGLETGGTIGTVSSLRFDVETRLRESGVSVSSSDLAALQSTADSMTTVNDFMADATTVALTKQAFGLQSDPLSNTALRDMLNRAVVGDFSAADSQSDSRWGVLARSVAASLNGQTYSSVRYNIELEVSGARLDTLAAQRPPDVPDVDAEELAYFSANVDSIETSEDLLADRRLLDVALTAFGLENEDRSDAFIQEILDEDPYDPNSFVNTLSDTRWRDFSRAFNPDPDPNAGTNPAIWQFELERLLTEQGAPQSDIDTLRRDFANVDDVLDIALFPDLMEVVISAFGLPKDTFTSSFFTSMVLSDASDPNAFVNRFNDDNWKALNELLGIGAARSNAQLDSFVSSVTDSYVERAFEASVGAQDQNLRLALNFTREIGAIAESGSVATAGWFAVMGSEPLRRVVDTAFGFSPEFAQLELEQQERAYQTVAQAQFGGSDPSIFTDAAVVSELLNRFLIAAEAQSGVGPGAPGYAALQVMNQTAAFSRIA